MVQFVIDGQITEDGKKAIGYIESVVNASKDDLAKLNVMPGFVQHYHVNVMALKALTPVQWLEDYRASGAKAAYDRATELLEAEKKEQARDEANNKIAEGLAEVQKQLAEALTEIKALKEGAAKPAPKKPVKKETPVEETPDEDGEGGDSESEA